PPSPRSPISTRPSPGPNAAPAPDTARSRSVPPRRIIPGPTRNCARRTPEVADGGADARRAAERAARESYGRLLAFLAARTRDVAGAEDALAEAFAAALAAWPHDGVPHHPDAWLLTVARRRRSVARRRRQARTAGEELRKPMSGEDEAAAAGTADIRDARRALLCACARPASERDMRAPWILQANLGLTAQDIAASFLIPPATRG